MPAKILKSLYLKNWLKREICIKLAQNIGIFLFLLSNLFLLGSSAMAQESLEKTDIFIPAGTVYDNVLFMAGENVEIDAHMKDDVYVAGANIILSGLVEGDVIAAGANVQINAQVRGNVRIAGASVTLNGNIDGNVTVVAGELTIDDNIQIGKNLLFAGGNLQQNGQIRKNLYAAAGNIILNNQISGSAYIAVDPDGILVLYPKTNIAGNLEYTAKNRAEIKEGAQIQKQEKFSQFQPRTNQSNKNFFKVFFSIAWFIGLLGSIVVGLVVISLFKDFALKIIKLVESNVPASMLKGFLFLVATPVALLILAVTMIGLPLALIIFSLYLIVIYLAKIFFGLYLGFKIIKLIRKDIKDVPLIWAMILGLVFLYILFVIPIIGILVRFLACLVGLGVLLTVLKKELNLNF
jgi:cytoskeletal protein CcmA (bactofilin family)